MYLRGRGEYMEIVKIPRMQKQEYDRLIHENHICRIAFQGEDGPYIAPFMYIFDGRYLYFLSTRYGKKIGLFRKNPSVAVEIEQYARDLSTYTFVTLRGCLEEVAGKETKRSIKERFAAMLRERNLSASIMAALGHDPRDPPEALVREDRTMVWKLTGVREIVALKNR
jgi:nitroimidazol reductase NimA-like FMN-containing flavoprotein (pyridoxamine 5'-phosphate oxidase superfamily)